jgi:hypothetical protein
MPAEVAREIREELFQVQEGGDAQGGFERVACGCGRREDGD